MKYLSILFVLSVFATLDAPAQIDKSSPNALLKEMTIAVQQQQYPGIHSLLIAKGNKLVYEHYFNGYKSDSLHDSRSSFKSIASLLVGIAIDKGMIKDVNQSVYDFFPEYLPFKNDDPRKKTMTIKNLLEMRSGFDCEEFNDTKDCENEMSESKNWVRFSLDLPMKSQPGTEWAYTSVNPMILSGIIHKASHMSVMDFARKYLFGPMGISNYKWTVDPSGNGMTAGSFYIQPADMLKIGQLVLNKGKWKGKQLISQKWITQSTAGTIPIPNFSFAKISKSKLTIPQPTYYGYYWYHEMLKTNEFQYDLLFASGNGGQYIFIVEQLNLVVVFTQGNFNTWKAKQAFDIMAKYILPGH